MMANWFNKKTPKWIVIAPFIVVVSIFIMLIFLSNWMNSARTQIQKNIAQKLHNERIEKIVNLKFEKLFLTLDLAKEFVPKLDNDEWLIEHLKYSLHTKDDIVYIFDLNKKNNKLFTLFSTQKDVEVGKYLHKNASVKIDKEQISKLLYHNQIDVSSKDMIAKNIHIVCKVYERSNLIVCVGAVDKSFEELYLRQFKEYSKELTRIKTVALFVVFMIGVALAFFISIIIKSISGNYEKSQLELKSKNKILRGQLYRDQETGLYNEKMLHRKIEEAKLPKLILIEVDDFKAILEYYGHECVEEIVHYVRERLLYFCQQNNQYGMTLFRVSNKQFALLEDAPLDMERYERLASILVQNFKGTVISCCQVHQTIDFTCTVSFSLEEQNTFETANISLRKAKDAGKDYLCYFKNLGENEEYKQQMQSTEYIKLALENDKVVPFFQPIFDKNKNITKYECLVRIISEDQEIIAPRIFLETSRKIKRYAEIEKSLIQKSFEAISGTKKVISINLSSRDMTDSDVSNFILESIGKYDLAEQVIFEILEDENIHSIRRVEAFIKKLKYMGARIAIDDFGSGYSNFFYMLSLKPDFLKIDGSLIKNIHQDAKSYAMVKAILAFAKKLGIRTIAEFVHNEEVFETCKSLEVDEFQGFYLGEPMSTLL